MNNYIINPSVFYWINVLSILQTVLAVFGSILVLTGIGTLIGYFYNISEHDTFAEDTKRKYIAHANVCMKSTIILFCIGLPMIVISIFIPGKQTSIEMLVARNATFDNVDWTVQQVE